MKTLHTYQRQQHIFMQMKVLRAEAQMKRILKTSSQQSCIPTTARCACDHFLLFLRSPIYTHDTIWWRTRWKWKGYILGDVFCHTNANHHSSSFQHLHPHSLWLALHFQSQAIVVKRWCYVPSSFEMHEIGKRNRNERIQVF